MNPYKIRSLHWFQCLILTLFVAANGTSFAEEAKPDNGTFQCIQKTAAFDCNDPGRQIGFFEPGTSLQVEEYVESAKMFRVCYRPSGGQEIRAFCRAEDLGKKPVSAQTPPGGSASQTVSNQAPVAVVSTSQRAWPKPIPPPKGMERTPGPWNDPAETTVWPNQTSCANSDPWLAANHDRIRSMHPRLLLINFSNVHSRGQINAIAKQLVQALAEASRYHGYANSQAPAFLNYEVFKFIDLSDGKKGDSRLVPIKDPKAKDGFNVKYSQFFSEEFAKHYDILDPCDPKRNLRLDEIIDGGYVHEVWFFGSGVVPEVPHVGAFEVVEEKPLYDEDFQKKGNGFVQAGNGGDGEQPWTGRSVRIGFVNASRGIGCFIESLSHGLEGCARSGAIPYLTKYFFEYAGFNLKERFNLPIESLYEVSYDRQSIRYPDEKTMVVTIGGDKHEVTNYVCTAGNVHFPPNGRRHYDIDNTEAVLSTIENWRTASGKDAQDLPKRFTNAAFRKYIKLAPDGTGPWLIYWRQNMPGLDNKQLDDNGKPMKNWWPFLFY